MKLTFKDLRQQKFTIEADPSETIGQIKAKIANDQGWEISTQKLIYSGKILKDEETVESYKIEEKGFIVCMISKPKAAPAKPAVAAAPETPAPKIAATPAAPQAPSSSNAGSAAPATPSPAAGSAAPGSGRFDDPSALALGAERESAISNMEAMGFPRADIDRAMRAAFFNPDRAVEYLLNGIPEDAGEQPAPSPAPAAETGAAEAHNEAATGEEPVNLFEAAAQAGQTGRQGRTAGATGAAAGIDMGAAGGDALEFLRNNPQFQQLRQIVQAQPQMLEPILQQVAAGNPQIAQLIAQNPEQFMQLLAEDADDGAALPPGGQQIVVTPEERDAIDRLCRLGFDHDMVVQAYFACDKNEELAANFLFDQPDEGDE